MAHASILLLTCIFLLMEEGFSLTEPTAGMKTPEDDEIWCQPEQVHLSYGTSVSEVVIIWSTHGHCDTQVAYAPHTWNLNQSQKGTGLELEHLQNNSDLVPSNTYFYRPTLNNGVGAGPFFFKTPPANNTSWSPSFLISGNLDLERSYMKSVIEETLTGDYSAWLYTGDLEEKLTPPAGGKDSTFLKNVEKAATLLPLLTVPGKKGDGEDGFYLYRHSFSMPSMDWPMPSDRQWYSLDVGLVHLVVYSTAVFSEVDPKNAKAQQAWLLKDLADTNKRRSETPWVIALGQQPMYCSFGVLDVDECTQNTSKVRRGLEDILYFFGVDLVVQSKHAAYERCLPQYKGVVVSDYNQPRAPIQIITGSELGGKEGTNGNDVNVTARITADWSAFHLLGSEVTPSFARLSVANSSHLLWELLSAADMHSLDSFWIIQETHGNFSLASLPHNISDQINQTILALGGKPGTYDFISGSTGDANDGEGWSKYSLWLGLAALATVLVLILGMIGIRTCLRRKRARAGRRWREMDRDGGGGGNFYSVASDSDTEDNDFEIDVYDSTKKQSSKLLTSY